MFSIFIYLFSAIVSFWASAHFYKAWKRTNNQNYQDFFLFFSFTGLSFVLYSFATGMFAEIGLFFMLLGFVFVLRIFARFQQIKKISPNAISIIAAILSAIEFFISLNFLPQPTIQNNLVYWNIPSNGAITYSALIAIFTLVMAVTFLSNLANIKKNRLSLFFLGIGFFFASIGGSLLVWANTFWLVLTSYLLIFVMFVCISIFLIISHRKDN